ncbi:MAG: heat-inducible transcription repressor HrcA [Clostridia bacterium]|jgi:heat-inducible transcriptional repressor|nr:heat-inducible transcription repressor HrcA [Clostridia bacterium]
MAIGDELSPRKKQILKAVIDAHIENGEPVGSKYLTASTDIGCSSATIRNEMAELEDLGYLEHPHTSAGRVPTPLGYRFYVDSLMNDYALTAHDLSIINTLQQMKMSELDRILQTASKLTAAVTSYTGVAVVPKRRPQTVRCYKTSLIDGNNFVISFITDGNQVQSKYVNVPFPVTEDMLFRLSGILNNNIAGMTSDMITLPIIMKMQAEAGDAEPLLSYVMKCIYEITGDVGVDDVHIEGVGQLLEYPEYSDMGKLRELLSLLEKKEDLVELVENSKDDGVSVYIGGEDETPVVSNSSIIVKPLKRDGNVVGAIGVVGPNRMEYNKVVKIVEYIADLISRLLSGASLPEPDDKKKQKKGDGDG